MKLYNLGTEMFCFAHGGMSFFVYPKLGTFERKRDPYEVEITSPEGKITKLVRHRDIWVKTSEEGVNNNFVEVDAEHMRVGMHKAQTEGREDIQPETVAIKREEDRLAAMKLKVQEREEELKKHEHDMNVKLAMLKKVEEEAVSKFASKHK